MSSICLSALKGREDVALALPRDATQIVVMARSSTSKAELARNAWSLMFDFLVSSATRRSEAMGRRGLSPNDMRALSSLSGNEGRTMRALAEEWRCDASNATLIVNRLEEKGLAERLQMPGDARFRLVQLTPRGRRLRAELLEEFHTPPSELLALTGSDLATLGRIMKKIPTPAKAASSEAEAAE